MYAPHFAAALAVKSRAPEAPVWALFLGAFLPDLAWIVLARIGVEPTAERIFYDGWSHSLVCVLIMASVFAAAFWKRGRAVVVAIWIAVFSHFMLDFPVHPQRLLLCPGLDVRLGWNLLSWGTAPGWLGAINDWWLQAVTLLPLLAIYVWGMRRTSMPMSLIAASCVILLGAQLLMLSSAISY